MTTTNTPRGRSHTGTVHLAGYMSRRDIPKGRLTQLCGFSGRQRYTLERVDVETPVTCAKCQAKLAAK